VSPPPPPAIASNTQVPNEVLVVLRAGVATDAAATLARRHALDLIDARTFTLGPTTIDRFRIRDRRSVAAVLRALAADPLVLSAQPNHLFTLSGSSEPSGLARAQYAITALHLAEAHHLATGRGVSVAVIDSMVDVNHPALAGAIGDGTDLLGPDASQAADPHGTAIVGLIGARATLDSAAPQARILAIRTFARQTDGGATGASGTTFLVLRGLDWAAAHGARIVNMSFAGPQDDLMSAFLAAGAAKGAVYVAAAGNAGPGSPPLYPAADPHVLAVTATDAENRLYPMANRGPYIALAAPGADIVVATPGGGFGYTSGTSMAAAEISGIVALMLQEAPDLTPADVRAALTGTSQPLAPADAALDGGAGLADAQGALKRLDALADTATGRAVAARP
jgi:subtilisin family serine protease